jgi:hypothetical protein
MESGNEELYHVLSARLITRYSGEQIQKNGMGGAWCTCGRKASEVITEFWWRYLQERDRLEDRDIIENEIIK